MMLEAGKFSKCIEGELTRRQRPSKKPESQELSMVARISALLNFIVTDSRFW